MREREREIEREREREREREKIKVKSKPFSEAIYDLSTFPHQFEKQQL